MSDLIHLPPKQGLYDPELEKDACGVGFIAQIKGVPSHQIVLDADTILQNMDHRGACGCETNTGDGFKMPRWIKPYLQFVLPAMILVIIVQGLI